jgi:sigma-B regulation protein RsbU (phosphoserine phosphatase)
MAVTAERPRGRRSRMTHRDLAMSGSRFSGTDAGEGGSAEAELHALRLVTDSALTRMGVDDLLDELLVRVREILGADTAAVLMRDDASQSLVARAACGLEQEVRQSVHVPIGLGFAGRIAASKRPLVLDRVDATTVSNPILIERGIRTMLGVPLLTGGDVLGVLHVGRLDDKPFDEGDSELLQLVGERVVAAVETHQLAVERAAAVLLERSLLPTELPDCRGLTFASRYVAADDRSVGGDWYDMFTMPSGDLWVVVGDVAGHGLSAAVVMGRIRSTLHSYALVAREPHTVLELAARKIEHFELNALATVVCAVSTPPYDVFRIALAGHPPPVIAAPGAPAAFPDLPVGPPLGVGADEPRSSTEVPLPEGSVMALYTDGLIERRGEVIDAGLERLRRAVRADEPEAVCNRVLRELIGARIPTDDIAMVALHRAGRP